MHSSSRPIGLLSTLLGLATGCSGDDVSGSSTCSGCSNVAGVWDTSEAVDGTACGNGTYTQTNSYLVTQTGCSLTVKPVSSSLTFQGTICNDTLSWSGSYPEGDGTTTITSSSYTLSGSSLSGTARWTWSGSGRSCSGSTVVNGTKQ